MTFASVDALRDAVGEELGYSDWLEIDQKRIDLFADATGDHQWIHVDPERAAAGPFGTTIAHGYLTLSLLPLLRTAAHARRGREHGRQLRRRTRCVSPRRVPVGSRLRATRDDHAVERRRAAACRSTARVTVEREGGDKPVCVAESVARFYS